MAENTESTMKWKVDINDFTRAMREAKRSISLANAEFKSNTAELGKWTNSITGVGAKITQLTGQLDGQQRILDVLKEKYNGMSEGQRENTAEGQKLAIQIKNQEAAVKSTKAQIGYYNDQLNKLEQEQKEAESATSKLTKEIEDQQDTVDKLKKAYKDSLVGDNPEDTKRLAKELKSASEELAQMKKKMNDADKAADDLDASLDETGDSARSASEGFTVFKGALANLVSQGISRVIQGVKDLGSQTFEAGANFEAGMSKVAAISGASGAALEQLTAKAEEMGSKTKFTATEAASAFEYMAMAGWKTEDMLGGIEGIMNLAAASGADLAKTSDIVTDALTAMGYEAKDAGQLADVMAAASSNANTNVELMGQTFQYAAPIIGALGYSMEDAAVSIGLMANAGIKGEKAGTALRSILTRLSAPPKECAEAMDALNLSLIDGEGNMKTMDEVIGDLRTAFSGLSETEQTAMAKSIAGQEAMSGLLAIVRAAPTDYDKLTEAVEKSSGAAEKMAETMNDNVSGQITLLKSKIEGIMIKVFDKASGSIKKALNTISKALDRVDWDKFAKNAGKAAEKVANLFEFVIDNGDTIIATLKAIAMAFVTYKAVSIVTSVIGAFTKLHTALKTGQTLMQALNLTMTASPVGLIAAAVVGLGSAVAMYAKNAHDAQIAQYGLNEEQQTAIDKISEMVDEYNNLKQARDESVSQINAEFGHINELKDEYNGLIDSNGKVKEGYEDRANFILTTLADSMGLELDQIKELIDSNGKLSDSIDEVIRKKQAEALLAANEQIYNNAIANRATALKNLSDAQAAVDEAEQEYMETSKEAQRVWDNYYQLMKRAPDEAAKYLSANNNIIEGNNVAKKSYEDASKKLDEAEDAWIDYNTTIKNYEGLASAIISGDSEKIQSAMVDLQNGFITAETGNRESLERQVQNYRSNLGDLQKAIQNGTPSVTKDMVDQAQSMVTAAEKELAKLPPEAATKGIQTGVNFAKNLGNQAASAKTAGHTVGSFAVSGADSGSSGMNKAGKDAGDKYNSGVESKKSEAKTKGTSLATEAKSGAESVDASSSGKNFGDGFLGGIGSKLKDAWNKGWELAANALSGLKAGGGEGSPWKKAIPSGGFFGEGFIKGIESMMNPVANVAGEMARTAIDALGKNMNDQMLLIGEDGANSLIEGMNGVLPNMSASIGHLKASVASANTVLSDADRSGVGSFTSEGQKVQNVTFNQYNNSPKAMDRLSVYRETNNLLFSAKVRLQNV